MTTGPSTQPVPLADQACAVGGQAHAAANRGRTHHRYRRIRSGCGVSPIVASPRHYCPPTRATMARPHPGAKLATAPRWIGYAVGKRQCSGAHHRPPYLRSLTSGGLTPIGDDAAWRPPPTAPGDAPWRGRWPQTSVMATGSAYHADATTSVAVRSRRMAGSARSGLPGAGQPTAFSPWRRASATARQMVRRAHHQDSGVPGVGDRRHAAPGGGAIE